MDEETGSEAWEDSLDIERYADQKIGRYGSYANLKVHIAKDKPRDTYI